MDTNTGLIRAAVAALIRPALESLRDVEGAPRIQRVPDNQRWWRHGQESFVGLNPRAWIMNDTVTHYKWLDSMPQMVDVRRAFAAHPVLGPRVDAPLGTMWSRQPRQLGWMLVEHIITPMVLQTRSYDFDEAAFDAAFERLANGLGTTDIHMVEFVPLNGFTCTEELVGLPDGLMLRPMTDLEMSAAIDHLAVPRMSGGTVNSAHVSRFHQWALAQTTTHPVVAGHNPPEPATPSAFPALQEKAARLVTALRIVCGGSVVASRSMYAQASGEFPIVSGTSAIMSAFDPADEQRPTVLTRDDLNAVLRVHQQLGLTEIQLDKQLQVAIRRAVFAGSRALDGDRLVDWMTAAESLFIKRARITGPSKGKPMATGAAAFLADDPVLGASSAQIEAFMREAYNARNAEIHGDGDPHPNMLLLSGKPTNSASLMVADVERLMRRTLVLVLDAHAFESVTGP
jgi:hypothetical protein